MSGTRSLACSGNLLHAHAARGAEGSYNRCCDTGNHLYYKLNGLFLCHNFNGLIG